MYRKVTSLNYLKKPSGRPKNLGFIQKNRVVFIEKYGVLLIEGMSEL
jgi:hypothetical protein